MAKINDEIVGISSLKHGEKWTFCVIVKRGTEYAKHTFSYTSERDARAAHACFSGKSEKFILPLGMPKVAYVKRCAGNKR